ncbi:MAG: hypothetical protein QF826_06470 [Acidimicrobiales bacterium]|nr:hypothetical protein [Acidimicrobiales bacterium]
MGNRLNTRLKRIGFVALAVFFILAGIGAVLDEDVQNATPREVMGFVGGLLAVLLLVGLYFVLRDTEATKRWWIDFGERHLFLKKIGQRLYRFYKTTLPPIRVAFWLLPLTIAASVWWVIEYEDVQEYGRGNVSGYGFEGEEIQAGQGFTTLIVIIVVFAIAVLVSTVKYVLRWNKPLDVKNKSKYEWQVNEQLRELEEKEELFRLLDTALNDEED